MSPRHKIALSVLLALIGGIGWLGLQSLSDRAPMSRMLRISLGVAEDLPDTPDEWHGRIDYRALDQQLTLLSQRPEMAGLAVAIIEEGELRFVRTYGVVDRSTGAPVTAATVFRWASVSKTATGVLAATLAQEHALDLEHPVSHWKTSLRLPQGAEARLTLAQLLSQQTGLTKNAYDEKLEDGQNPALLRATLAAAPLQCLPGTCHTYQNVAFDASSEILGEAAGTPFADTVERRFFRPLGMASAGYGMEALTGAKDWARPHHMMEVRPVKEAYWRVPAAAGVSSNIIDFAKWMQATMGNHPDVLPGPVLQVAQSARVATPRLYSGDLAKALTAASYGLGWRNFAYGNHGLAGHSGAVAGYRATMIFDPSTRTGVVAMWNSNWGIPFRIPFAVFDSYDRQAASRWLDLSDIPLPGTAPGEGADAEAASPAVTPVR